jgi:hypothetical protein
MIENLAIPQTETASIRRRLQGLQEYTADQVQLLTAADTKLSAAIVAAHSRHRGSEEAPAPIDHKTQPATAGRSRKTAEAVNKRGRGLRSAP